jgi:CheY-like chemotaxis protein
MTSNKAHLLNNLRILVVDDDEVSRLVACEILSNLGGEVDSSPSPDDTMQKVENEQYDLIILDLFMPQMNGMELANALITSNHELKSKIIILTASEFPDNSEFALNTSPFKILSKPLDVNELASIISLQNEFEDTQENSKNQYQDIYGIDIVTGIRNFFGHEHAFFQTLHAFPDYGNKFISDYNQYLQSNNIKECHRLAHSLKGSSSMIGAKNINALAKQLENACSIANDPQGIEALFHAIEKEILQINISIQRSTELQVKVSSAR